MSLRLLVASAALAAAMVVIAGCSSESAPKAMHTGARAPIDELIEDPAGREPVAKVNGVAIYGDCVQRQAEAHGLSKQAALGECIDFELLAQAADDPRYLLLPEVQEPATQEMVRSFLSQNYPYGSAATLPDKLVKALWKQVSPSRYNRPELRDIVFCRIALPEDASAQSEEAKRAEAYLRGVYKQLKGRKELASDDLFAACYGPIDLPEGEARPYEAAGIESLTLNTFSPRPRAQYDAQFHATVFDGPQVAGMVLPPLLSRFGWDLILLTQIIPAIATDYSAAEPELRRALFEEPVYETQRAQTFTEWYKPLELKHQVTLHLDAIPMSSSTLPTEASPPQDTAPAPAAEDQP